MAAELPTHALELSHECARLYEARAAEAQNDETCVQRLSSFLNQKYLASAKPRQLVQTPAPDVMLSHKDTAVPAPALLPTMQSTEAQADEARAAAGDTKDISKIEPKFESIPELLSKKRAPSHTGTPNDSPKKMKLSSSQQLDGSQSQRSLAGYTTEVRGLLANLKSYWRAGAKQVAPAEVVLSFVRLEADEVHTHTHTHSLSLSICLSIYLSIYLIHKSVLLFTPLTHTLFLAFITNQT